MAGIIACGYLIGAASARAGPVMPVTFRAMDGRLM
jgi:hypothetical protein